MMDMLVKNPSTGEFEEIINKTEEEVFEERHSNSWLTLKGGKGSKNSALHPKVLYFENGLFGHKFWMAYTPWPSDTHENPTVAYSDNGITWTTIPNSPINQQPEGSNGFFADPCICYNSITNQLEVWYLSANNIDVIPTQILRQTSGDGLTWSSAEQVTHATDFVTSKVVQSFAVIHDSVLGYRIWLKKGQYYESSVADQSSWVLVRTIVWGSDANNDLFHFDVNFDGEKYRVITQQLDVELTGTGSNKWKLSYLESDDNITYTTPKPLLRLSKTKWASGNLYKTGTVTVGDKIYIYYSGLPLNWGSVYWRIGLSIAPKSDIFKARGIDSTYKDISNTETKEFSQVHAIDKCVIGISSEDHIEITPIGIDMYVNGVKTKSKTWTTLLT